MCDRFGGLDLDRCFLIFSGDTSPAMPPKQSGSAGPAEMADRDSQGDCPSGLLGTEGFPGTWAFHC